MCIFGENYAHFYRQLFAGKFICNGVDTATDP